MDILEKFKHFRNDFYDDLPSEDVRFLNNYKKYKCRTNYFQKIFDLLENPEINQSINQSIREIREKMIENIRSFDFTKFRTQEEINSVNELLDKMIQELEKESTLD